MKTGMVEFESETYTYREMALRYKMLQDNTQLGVYGFENAKTRAIFEDGICVLTENRLEKGNLIKIELSIDTRILKAFCDVEWCNWDDEAGAYEAKLTFIALKEEDILALAQFIKKNR